VRSMSDQQNPLVSASLSFADVETALAKGGVGPAEAAAAMRAMEAVLAEREERAQAELAAVRAELQDMRTAVGASARAGMDPLKSAVLDTVAKLTEAPCNFHQATVYFCASDELADEEYARKAPVLMLTSWLLVLLQCMASMGVYVGTFRPSCASSDHCAPGLYCENSGGRRCIFCGQDVPLPLDTDGPCTFNGFLTVSDPVCRTYNEPIDPNFSGFNLTRVATVCTTPYIDRVGLRADGGPYFLPAPMVKSWCERCVHAIDGTVDPLVRDAHAAANIGAMGFLDNAALIFSSAVIALKVVGELKVSVRTNAVNKIVVPPPCQPALSTLQFSDWDILLAQ
jgi:hypothetical protein